MIKAIANPLIDKLAIRYHNADKFWLSMSAAALAFGLLIPSGAIGMVMLLVAREYLRIAEEI